MTTQFFFFPQKKKKDGGRTAWTQVRSFQGKFTIMPSCRSKISDRHPLVMDCGLVMDCRPSPQVGVVGGRKGREGGGENSSRQQLSPSLNWKVSVRLRDSTFFCPSFVLVDLNLRLRICDVVTPLHQWWSKVLRVSHSQSASSIDHQVVGGRLPATDSPNTK